MPIPDLIQIRTHKRMAVLVKNSSPNSAFCQLATIVFAAASAAANSNVKSHSTSPLFVNLAHTISQMAPFEAYAHPFSSISSSGASSTQITQKPYSTRALSSKPSTTTTRAQLATIRNFCSPTCPAKLTSKSQFRGR
ncbi:hypothetical protein Ddc_12402 [Ditylenchus destructor]|nr:hypothetical protein Ddc_12402 [Ditylenchus destructor]